MKQFTSLPLVEAWHKFNLVGPLGGTLKMHETVQSVLKIYIFLIYDFYCVEKDKVPD